MNNTFKELTKFSFIFLVYFFIGTKAFQLLSHKVDLSFNGSLLVLCGVLLLIIIVYLFMFQKFSTWMDRKHFNFFSYSVNKQKKSLVVLMKLIFFLLPFLSFLDTDKGTIQIDTLENYNFGILGDALQNLFLIVLISLLIITFIKESDASYSWDPNKLAFKNIFFNSLNKFAKKVSDIVYAFRTKTFLLINKKSFDPPCNYSF